MDENLVIDHDPMYTWADHLGQALLGSVEVSIGGTVIDKMSSTMLRSWAELAGEIDAPNFGAVPDPVEVKLVCDEVVVPDPVEVDEIAELNALLNEFKHG